MMGKGQSKHKRDNDLAQAERLTMMANMKMAYADALIKQYHTSPAESRVIVSPLRSRSHECLSTVRVSRDQNQTTTEACREDVGLSDRRSRATSMATLASSQQEQQQQPQSFPINYSKSFPRRNREFKKVLVHNHPDLTKLQNEQNKRRESMERRFCEIRKHAEEEEKRKSLPLSRQQPDRPVRKTGSFVNTNSKESPLLKMPGVDQDERVCITESPLLRLIHNEKRRKNKINNNDMDDVSGTNDRTLDTAFDKTNDSVTAWHSISSKKDRQLDTAFHSNSESVDSWHSISSTSSAKSRYSDSDDSGEIIPVRVIDSLGKQQCAVNRENETLTEGKVRQSHKPLVKQSSQGVDPFSLDLFKNNSPWLLLLLPILLPALLLSVIVKALSQTRPEGKESVKGREQQHEQQLNNHVIR